MNVVYLDIKSDRLGRKEILWDMGYLGSKAASLASVICRRYSLQCTDKGPFLEYRITYAESSLF